MHAGACAAGRDHESGGMAGRTRQSTELRSMVERDEEDRRPREPVRRCRSRSGAMGGGRGRRPRRALHGAVCRAFEAGRGDESFSRYAEIAASSLMRWASASTRGTISICEISRYSGASRILHEVSIGHALVSHALYVGLDRSVRDTSMRFDDSGWRWQRFLDCVRGSPGLRR